jgi:energy-coupling factor transporter ATP-binding protein EcfA2
MLHAPAPFSLPTFENLIPAGGKRIGFCSSQELVQPHLSARENLRLFAALHGIADHRRVDDLLARNVQGDLENRRADLLPRSSLRTLLLMMALLPDPNVLLIDDLTAGLSLPARRGVWRAIRAEQARRPRAVIFATRDLEAARFLADEVCWIENGQLGPVWRSDELPPALRAAAAYAFDLRSTQSAHRFYESIAAEDFVLDRRLHLPGSVEVLATDKADIVTLTWLAGVHLTAFRTLPLEVDRLLSQKPAAALENGQLISSQTGSSTSPRHRHAHLPSLTASRGSGLGEEVFEVNLSLNTNTRAAAVAEVIKSVWRGHFRSFWGAGNPVLSSVVLLAGMQSALSIAQGTGALLRVSPLLLMLSACMIFGFGLEGMSRLTTMAGIGNLFQRVQATSADRQLSFLALVDLAGLRRSDLLAGLAIGHLAVAGAHAGPALLWGYVLWVVFPETPWPAVAGLLFWLASAVAALAVMILVSGLLPRPGWGQWVGWCLWPAIPLASWLLPGDFPILWLWPFTGFTTAFKNSTDPDRAWAPLLCACLGTALLCFWAQRAFRRRASILDPSR